MKRFTYKHDDEWCINGVNGKVSSDNQANYRGEAINRLAEYENFAEEERLVILPCKVGDKVWVPFIDGDIAGLRVQSITIGPTGKVILNLNDYPLNNVWGDEIGKTIYLSKEEAEKHLTDESKKYIM